MSGECEKCGEHCLDCKCLDISISMDIQSRIAPIYEKYKDYPNELIDAFEFFIESVGDAQEKRLMGIHAKSSASVPHIFMDNIIFNWWPFTKKEELKKDDKSGYICRLCAVKMGAVPPVDHVCTWHRAKCHFCGEEANLCHTSDWNWPNKRDLERNREF